MAQISIISGHIGRDAERKTVGEHTVVEFSVAETTKKGGKEYTSWFRVTVWDNYGNALLSHLVKGAKCSINGELIAREYTDRDGNTRLSLDVRAGEVNVPYREEVSAETRRPPASPNVDVDDDIPF